MLVGLVKLCGWYVLSRPIGRYDIGSVGRLDDDLEIGFAARGGNVGQGEAVDVALVRDEVEIRADSRLGRVNEAEVSHHIHNPEVLVSGRGLHDLLGRRDDDQRRVLDLGANRHNVLGVVGTVRACS